MDNSPQIPLVERYQRLLDISRDLASTLELDTLLSHIVKAAAHLCMAEAASILLYDHAKNQLHFEAATNLDAPLMRGILVPVESSIAGWIVTHCEPLIIPDTGKDPRHYTQVGKITQVETSSLLGVPMTTKGKVVGVLEAINKRQGEFTPEDQDILMALGAQAAVAIENARLFQQSDLIAELIHELRTPLSSLNTAAYLLSRPQTQQINRDRIIETLLHEISRLSAMTTDYLSLARLESGRTRFQILQLDLSALLIECVALVQAKIADRNQQIDLQVADELLYMGDRDKLKQVVLNLITNASNYTDDGGSIFVSGASNQEQVEITVRDTGVGISEEHLERIFEKFYRVPGSERNSAGTGLGLSICKRIVEVHGGKISVESIINQGTTFRVVLPQLPAHG